MAPTMTVPDTPRSGARSRSGRRGSPTSRAQLVSVVRPGGSQVSDVQRARMLRAAMEVVAEQGFVGMSVARVTSRAGVSRRTFYDLFQDRDDCFLMVFEDAMVTASMVVSEVARAEQTWREQVRAGLGALLMLIDDEPRLGSLLVVDALSAGPNVLERRAQLLSELAVIIDRGRSQARAGRKPPPLTAEGVVGAVFSVVHARMLSHSRQPLIELLGPLMGMIVLPYLGPGVAAKELPRPAPAHDLAAISRRSSAPIEQLEMRFTYRTLRVLSAVAGHPGASNRLVADRSDVHDQGQISKLLTRLESLGLVENLGRGQARGEPNAWRLTCKGEHLQRSINAQSA
jgi:AcrR family transcriptional regulator